MREEQKAAVHCLNAVPLGRVRVDDCSNVASGIVDLVYA